MQVEIWSDIACPWCYVGKRRFEQALSRFPHRDEVEVTWRSFELDPNAPRSTDESATAMLARKYGVPLARAEQMNAQMTQTAAAEGLDFHFDRVRLGNTFDAHRLVHLAHSVGLQDAMKERLMRAYFSEGQPVSARDVLQRLGEEVGLDATRVREVLAGDAYTEAVRGDELEARQLGVNGVPFFVLDRKYGVSGAQGADVLLQAITQAYEESSPRLTSLGGDAEACGPAGCEL